MERTDSPEMSEATYGSKRCENLEDYKINLKSQILYRSNSLTTEMIRKTFCASLKPFGSIQSRNFFNIHTN
jgi:hypothetical protein